MSIESLKALADGRRGHGGTFLLNSTDAKELSDLTGEDIPEGMIRSSDFVEMVDEATTEAERRRNEQIDRRDEEPPVYEPKKSRGKKAPADKPPKK